MLSRRRRLGESGCSLRVRDRWRSGGCLLVQGMLSTCAVSRRPSRGSHEFVASGAATAFSARMSSGIWLLTRRPSRRAAVIDRFDPCTYSVETPVCDPSDAPPTAGRVEVKSAFFCGFFCLRADEIAQPLLRAQHRTRKLIMDKRALRHDLPGGVVVERLPRGQQPRKLVAQLRPLPRDVRVLS